MAVALVQGHGPNRLGGVEPFETYRFKNAEDDSTDYRAQCAWWGGRFHPYRTPGYPAFLAGVYAVFGISPARAQEAQLAQTRTILPPLEKQLAQNRHQLAVLAGKPPAEAAALPEFELTSFNLPQELPVSGWMRVPKPPAIMTAFIRGLLSWEWGNHPLKKGI